MYYFRRQISRKRALLIVLALSFIILLLPHMLRFARDNSSLIGYESYYNAWHSSQADGRFVLVEHNPLGYEGVKDIFDPYQLLLSLVSIFLDIGLVSRLIPFIMGIASALLFYLILPKLELTENKAFLSTLFFISSPIFIYIFSVSSRYSLVVLLNLVGLYAFMRNRRYFYLALVSYMLITFFGVFDSLASCAILLIYTIFNKKNKRRFYIILVSMFVTSFIYYGIIYMNLGLPEHINGISAGFLQQFITALGARTGFSIFMLFLVASGVIASWKQKKIYYPLYLFMFLFTLSSIYLGPFANIYLNFIFSGFAGMTIFTLIRRRWELNIIRNLLLAIILCGIIFSSFSYITQLSVSGPDDDMIFPLLWLGKHTDNADVVLSHPQNSYIIRMFAAKTPFTDMSYNYAYYDYTFGSTLREKTAGRIFHSRYLQNATALLDENNISYIYIDNQMKKGLVWKEDKQEFLFLLRNKENFKRIIKTDNAEIYQYIGKTG